MTTDISTSARLLRGFAIDFLTSHDVGAVEWVMDPAYCLTIGGHVFDGRDTAYLPATAAQLEQFPGLCVTVHDVILGNDAMAMRFTEHGVSIRNSGRAAAWGGITLFRIRGGRLLTGWAEEDYFARKRQLKSGHCDSILPPHPAPWDLPSLAPDAGTEIACRHWLEKPGDLLAQSAIEAICSEGPSFAELILPAAVSINSLISAGPRAAFHATCQGTYAGGFADIDPALTGTPISLPMAGMVRLDDQGNVHQVQLSADRLGLHRALSGVQRQ